MAEGVIEVDAFKGKEAWKQTREICWLIYLANTDKKTAVKTREEFMPIDTTQKAIRKPSKKRIQDAVAKLEARLNKK